MVTILLFEMSESELDSTLGESFPSFPRIKHPTEENNNYKQNRNIAKKNITRHAHKEWWNRFINNIENDIL